ncbi:hypothetical protein J3F84DRAFT_361170 [Trichoderma pleuroticola]
MNIREDAVKQGPVDQQPPNRANGPMNVGVAPALEDPEAAIHIHSKAVEKRRGSNKYEAEQIYGFALNYLDIGRCWWVVGKLEMAASCFKPHMIIYLNNPSRLHDILLLHEDQLDDYIMNGAENNAFHSKIINNEAMRQKERKYLVRQPMQKRKFPIPDNALGHYAPGRA